MPDIHTSFTNREVLEALQKAGWGHLLPSHQDLENPDEVCVEFTTSTDDSSDNDSDEDDISEDNNSDEEILTTAIESNKVKEIWDSLDD